MSQDPQCLTQFGNIYIKPIDTVPVAQPGSELGEGYSYDGEGDAIRWQMGMQKGYLCKKQRIPPDRLEIVQLDPAVEIQFYNSTQSRLSSTWPVHCGNNGGTWDVIVGECVDE